MKNILLFITGSVVGVIISASAIYAIYTKINAKPSDEAAVVPKQNLEVPVRSNANEAPKQTEKLPQATTLPPLQGAVSASYKLYLEKSVNSLNTVINSNNEVITPTMQGLAQKLQTGNWGDVFEDVKKVKLATQADTLLIKGALASLSNLEKENLSATRDAKALAGTEDFIQASRNFANSFSSYLASVDALLGGTVPTKQQLTDLNTKIADLSSKVEPFKKNGTSLFLIINQLNSKDKK